MEVCLEKQNPTVRPLLSSPSQFGLLIFGLTLLILYRGICHPVCQFSAAHILQHPADSHPKFAGQAIYGVIY